MRNLIESCHHLQAGSFVFWECRIVSKHLTTMLRYASVIQVLFLIGHLYLVGVNKTPWSHMLKRDWSSLNSIIKEGSWVRVKVYGPLQGSACEDYRRRTFLENVLNILMNLLPLKNRWKGSAIDGSWFCREQNVHRESAVVIVCWWTRSSELSFVIAIGHHPHSSGGALY